MEHRGPCRRDGLLFLLDLTPEIFNVIPGSTETYFHRCIQIYTEIMTQKLTWNRKDFMGIILYGTKTSSAEPAEVLNVTTLETFKEICNPALRRLMAILSHDIEPYKNMTAEVGIGGENPLEAVFKYASRLFHGAKVPLAERQIVLLTARNNPFLEEEDQRHRIRLHAIKLNEDNIVLKVVGLGENFIFEKFYRDLEMLANNVGQEDAKPTLLDDLQTRIIFKTRISIHQTLRITDEISVKTILSPFTSTREFFKELRLSSRTNEILQCVRVDASHRFAGLNKHEDSDSDSEEKLDRRTVDSNIVRTYKCGGKELKFSTEEAKKIRAPMPRGINLEGFKKISIDLLYHVRAPQLLSLDKAATDVERELFTAMLYQCKDKDLMGICTVHGPMGTSMAKLIPSTKHGGFYLYKIASFEQVRGVMSHDTLAKYKDGGNNANDASVDLMDRIIDRTSYEWDPNEFEDPKVRTQSEYLKALAFDKEIQPVHDTTLRGTDWFESRLDGLDREFYGKFKPPIVGPNKRKAGDFTKKPPKKTKLDIATIKSIMRSGRLHLKTVMELREIARYIGAPQSGLKADLIDSIKKRFPQ